MKSLKLEFIFIDNLFMRDELWWEYLKSEFIFNSIHLFDVVVDHHNLSSFVILSHIVTNLSVAFIWANAITNPPMTTAGQNLWPTYYQHSFPSYRQVWPSNDHLWLAYDQLIKMCHLSRCLMINALSTYPDGLWSSYHHLSPMITWPSYHLV